MAQVTKRASILSELSRQPLSAVSALILILIVLLAAGAYLIIPDKTTAANRQIPLMSLIYPGTTQDYILIDRGLSSAKTSTFQQLLTGYQDKDEYIPFEEYTIDGDQMIIYYKSTQRIVEISSGKEPSVRTLTHWAGTDTYGRDVLSRLILGLRVSLFVGFLSVLVSLFIGVLVGSLGGYFGGRIDKAIMLLINTSWSIPTILMAFAIIIALGKGFIVIVLAVGLTMWVDVARIVRGQVLQLKEELFVRASTSLGLNHARIIMRHM